jgi:outer membrane autotransporter protein
MRGSFRSVVAFCLGSSALTVPAIAGVIDYPNGTNNASPITLTDNTTQLQVLTGSATQSGGISESGGSWGLEKIGAGALTFSGTNSYSGGTTITGGTLIVPNDAALGATGGAVTLNGGMLEFGGGVTARNYIIQGAGGTFSAGDPNVSAPGNQTTMTGTISGPGQLTFTGFGGITLTGNNTYAGGTVIYEGAILVGNGGTTGSIVGDVVSGVGTGNAGINFDRSDNITFGGNISGLGYVAQYGTGTLTLTGNNTYAAYTAILQGRLAFASDANVGTGDIKIYGGTVQYNATFTSALNYQLGAGAFDTNGNLVALSGAVFTMANVNVAGGYGGLTKIGAGTLILTGLDTYQGPTLISGGILQIGNGGTTGSTGVGTSIVDNASLVFNRSDNVSLGAVISGSGSLTQIGPGTLTLTGANTYVGGTTVHSGSLQIGGGGVVGSIVGNVTDDATLIFNRSDNVSFANVVSGVGSLIQAGSGTLTLTGANSYLGGTTISAGALQIGSGGNTGSVVGNITNNSTLIFNRSDVFTYAGVVSGAGGLTQAGTGSTVLTGNNTYFGSTIISAGALNVLGSISSSASTVQSGGTLNGLGNVGAVTVQSGGTLAAGNPLVAPDSGNSVGTLTVNGNLTLASGTTYGAAFGFSSTSGWTFAQAAVTGTATVAGNLLADFPGYFGGYAHSGQYTLISANGALSGNFSSVSAPGLAGTGYHIANVSYDAHNAYLNIARDTFVWSATPVSSDWSTNANWQNGAVPSLTDIAYFGATNRPSVTIGPYSLGAASLEFQPGAPAYTFTIANPAATPVPPGFVYVPPTPCSGTCLVFAPTEVVNLDTGIVDNSSNPPSFLVGGVFDPSLLNFVTSGNAADASITAAAFGTVTFKGNSDAGPAAKLVTLSGGTFDFSQTTGPNGDNKVSAGSIAGAGYFVLGSNNLTVGALNSSTEVSGVISGTGGSLTKVGSGTLILSGANSYDGGTIISAGTLQIGNGGTSGLVLGNIADNATLAFNRSDAMTYAGVVSGSGRITKLGSGALILSGVNTYTGATTVSAGALSVNGSIASSAVTVASGATLNGTGTVGATTIQNGGTLAPGNSIGTLTVNGNLSLASGSIYNVEISPAASDRTNVSGTASLNGTVLASVASGAYSFGQRFTILTATGGVSGSFASLTGVPVSLKGQLSYDANNAYLTLSPNALAPLVSNPTSNQKNLVAAIDAAVAAGNVPPAGFTALYSLSGPALNSALDQISGQIGPNVTNAVGQGFLSFLSMTAGGGSGITGNFAPGSAYGKADAPHRAQLGAGEMRIWGAAYGGHEGLSGDTASGAAGVSSNNVGLIGGADKRLTDWLLAGVTLGLGRQQFHSGNGSGDSNDFLIGLYGRAEAGNAYLVASLGYGWHQITTTRTVTVSGTDVLRGKENAHEVGGRVEAGWRMPLDDAYSIAPYGAFAGESFESPAFTETALSGASTFALSYAAQTTSLGRSELGAHLERGFSLEHGMLTADVRTAWAHQLDDLPFTQASFISLPGAAFQTLGVRPARDTALLGLDLEIQNSSGLFFGLKGESQFGAGTTLVEGMGNFGWRW